MLQLCHFICHGTILIADCRDVFFTLSCIQFFTASLLCLVPMIVIEKPSLSAILDAWAPVLYAGVLSSGAGYTLQIIGQRELKPTLASLIMSFEAVISAIAGWLILGQSLTVRELAGCAVMFAAILLAQMPDRIKTAGTAA